MATSESGTEKKSDPWRAQEGPQLEAIKKHWVPEIFFGGAVGGGKLLTLDTRLPTPTGWTTMGEVRVGDELFDERGQICRVVEAFPVNEAPELIRLTFDDGASVNACVDHKWLTFDLAERSRVTKICPMRMATRRAMRPSRAKLVSSKPAVSANITMRNKQREYLHVPVTGTVRTTQQLVDTLYTKKGDPNHSVPVAAALEMPETVLPIDPYILGAWLGDGSTVAGSITGMDPEIFAAFEKHYRPGAIQRKDGNRAVSQTFYGLQQQLRAVGVLGDKHIPVRYLRAAKAQRLELIRGLMDTDGTVARASGSAEFCNTNERLIDGMVELIVSLGWKVTKRAGRAKLNGKDHGAKWTLKWMPDEIVFRLSRKASLQKLATRQTTKRRYIVSAQKIPSRPGRCIAVDSPSHLFLCGDAMVPTHNSDFMLGDFGQDVPNYGEAWKGIIFRKSYPQLEELVSRALAMYPPWFCLDVKTAWRAGAHTFHWPNGATLKFRHLENDDAWVEYLGHSYTWIGFDELPQWPTPRAYMELKTRLRSAQPVPNKRIRATGNPGGVGHGWIKKYFGIDRHPLGGVVIEPDTSGGQRRMFIRSRVTDNRILLGADPGYIDRLRDLGSDILVKQYLEGDWSVVAGAFFSEFSPNRHIIPNFSIPKEWMRYRSIDWGSAKPFSVGWYAVSDGTVTGIPRGALVKYREWYGAKPGREVDVGLKMTAEEVAIGILERQEDGEEMSMAVCDPNMYKEDGGPSIAERMSKISRTYQNGTTVFATHQAADNSRKSGWDMVRARLKGERNSPPMVFFFGTCEDTIRTIPSLQHDRGARAGLEDVDTDGEDHAADELRYACMARPWVRKSNEVEVPKFANDIIIVPNKVICKTTFNDLMKAAKRKRLADS